MSESIKLTYNVPGDDFTRAGEASSDVKGVLKKLGLSPVVVRKVAIAMYEGGSTAPAEVRNLGFGAGMGLPNMKKYSDKMEIISAPGEGTTVNMMVRIA